MQTRSYNIQQMEKVFFIIIFIYYGYENSSDYGRFLYFKNTPKNLWESSNGYLNHQILTLQYGDNLW